MRSSSGWIVVDDRCWNWVNLSCDRCTAYVQLHFHQGCPVNWIYTFVCSSWFHRTFSITSWSVFLSFHSSPFSHLWKVVVAVRPSSWPRPVPAHQRFCHYVRSRRPWHACAASPSSIDTTKRVCFSIVVVVDTVGPILPSSDWSGFERETLIGKRELERDTNRVRRAGPGPTRKWKKQRSDAREVAASAEHVAHERDWRWRWT